MEIIPIIAIVIAIPLAAWLLARLIVRLTFKGPSVGPFRFVEAVSERKDASMKYDLIKLKVGLPESTSGDVVSRELTIGRTVTADGELMAEEVLTTAMMELEFEAVQDSQVDLSCVAIDDAGNRSEPVSLAFTVADTVAPDLSGEFSLTAIGERTVGEDDEPAETPGDEAETETAEGDEANPASTPPSAGD